MRKRAAGFTIVELLVVIAIILVLAGLVLGTSSYVHNKAARSRAEAEIAAMSAALENYKADNGVYPVTADLNARTDTDPSNYHTPSLVLYKALSGDSDADNNRTNELKSYINFKPNQLSPAPLDANGNPQAVGFLADPFGSSYGYSTVGSTDPSKGYNPTFDLWSTSGSTNTASWVKNW